MTEDRKYVDIDDNVDLRELAEEVHNSGDTIVLCRGGEQLATVVPAEGRRPHRTAEEALAAFLSTAGSWTDEQAEEFLRHNEESRSLPGRPLVEF